MFSDNVSENNKPLSYFPAYDLDPTIEEAVESTKVRYKSKIFYYRLSICLMFLLIFVIVLILCIVFLIIPSNNSKNKSSSTLNIFYAASLDDIMTRVIGPDVLIKHNILINGTSAGSRALANRIEKGALPDIFISADTKIALDLMNFTQPSSNSNPIKNTRKIIDWYYPFGRTRLGFGYSYKSSHLQTFQAIQNGSLDWHTNIGGTMKIGRTDPNLDPKGYRTVILIKLAEVYYNITSSSSQSFQETFLGKVNEPSNIYTEERLQNLISEGDLDVGFFYEAESQWNVNSGFIPLPVDIDMSDPLKSHLYAKANYTNTQTGKVSYGSPIIYTISILNAAVHKQTAITFLQYLLKLEKSGDLLAIEGLYAYDNASFIGNATNVF